MRSLRAPAAIGAATVLAGFVVAQIVVGPPVVMPIAGRRSAVVLQRVRRLIWDRHRYWGSGEHRFTISRELIGGLAGQIGPYPTCCCAIKRSSLRRKAPADPANVASTRTPFGRRAFSSSSTTATRGSSRRSELEALQEGTFFVALDDPINDQTDPPVFRPARARSLRDARGVRQRRLAGRAARDLIGNPSAAPISSGGRADRTPLSQSRRRCADQRALRHRERHLPRATRSGRSRA